MDKVVILYEINGTTKKMVVTGPRIAIQTWRGGRARVALPEGWSVRQEWGARDLDNLRIVVVPRAGIGLFKARYRRTVASWPIKGEPNDNWPKYFGPWIMVPHDMTDLKLLDGCPVEVWDGPYLHRCSLGKTVCAIHGPFERAERCPTEPCRRPKEHGGRCDTS